MGGSKCRGIPLSWGQWAPWSKREPWGWPTLANDPRSWFGMVLWPFKLPIRAAEECRNVPDYRLRAIWAWGRVHRLALYWHCTSGMNGHSHTQTVPALIIQYPAAKHLWTVHLTACRQKNFVNVLVSPGCFGCYDLHITSKYAWCSLTLPKYPTQKNLERCFYWDWL